MMDAMITALERSLVGFTYVPFLFFAKKIQSIHEA
jgi:hypothetical protein